jgi:hypothetical protein
MKKLLLLTLIGCGTLAAQTTHYSRPRPYRADLFDHVQYDLDRAAKESYPNGRLQRAYHELNEFRSRYNVGEPARHELDSAIAAVRDLAKSDVLRPRDRDTLQNDLISMRQFRLDYRARVY